MRTNLRRNERGAALIEAAITIPIILLIAVGIFEFGRAYQTWQVLTNAAREGARQAILTDKTDADVQSTVQNYMKAGGLPKFATAGVVIERSVALGSNTASRDHRQLSVQFHGPERRRQAGLEGQHRRQTAHHAVCRAHAERKLGNSQCVTESLPSLPLPFSPGAGWRTEPTTWCRTSRRRPPPSRPSRSWWPPRTCSSAPS